MTEPWQFMPTGDFPSTKIRLKIQKACILSAGKRDTGLFKSVLPFQACIFSLQSAQIP